MNCSQMQELLSAYANDELPLTQREFVEEHLTSCDDCQRALADYESVRLQLSSLSVAEFQPDIQEATMSQIETLRTPGVPVSIQKILRPGLITAALVVVAVAALLFRFSGDSPVGGIASAYAATEALQSYRMSGSTIVSANGQSSVVGFEWEFTDKDRYHGKIIQGAPANSVEEFIIVGESQYQRISEGNQFSTTIIDVSGEGAFNVFNPFPGKQGTLDLLNSLIDLSDLPDTEISGVQTTHHRGRVDIDKIVDEQAAILDPNAADYQANLDFLDIQRKIIINVDLWIGKDDFQIRQMRLEGIAPTTGSGGVEQGDPMKWDTTVEFFDFDEPISIESPLTVSGEVQSEWRLSGGPPTPPIIETETR
jgi:hypothetical protein